MKSLNGESEKPKGPSKSYPASPTTSISSNDSSYEKRTHLPSMLELCNQKDEEPTLQIQPQVNPQISNNSAASLQKPKLPSLRSVTTFNSSRTPTKHSGYDHPELFCSDVPSHRYMDYPISRDFYQVKTDIFDITFDYMPYPSQYTMLVSAKQLQSQPPCNKSFFYTAAESFFKIVDPKPVFCEAEPIERSVSEAVQKKFTATRVEKKAPKITKSTKTKKRRKRCKREEIDETYVDEECYDDLDFRVNEESKDQKTCCVVDCANEACNRKFKSLKMSGLKMKRGYKQKNWLHICDKCYYSARYQKCKKRGWKIKKWKRK